MHPSRDPAPPEDRGSEPTGGPPPWGARRPGPLFRILLGLSRAVPQLPLLKQLAFLFRRGARAVGPDPVDVELRGLRLRLRTRGNISESTFLFMPRRWDPRERRFLERELPADPVVVDVGANAGGYVWFFLDRWNGRCRVLAVEPDPELRGRLRFNLRTNRVRNVEVVGVAVGTERREGRLRIDPDNRGQNALLHPTGDGAAGSGAPGAAASASGRTTADAPSTAAASVRVAVRPLVELVEEADLPKIDVLKIDVEGSEPAVLLDFFDRAPTSLLPALLLVEWQDTPQHAELGRRLGELGYERALVTDLNVGLVRREGRLR